MSRRCRKMSRGVVSVPQGVARCHHTSRLPAVAAPFARKRVRPCADGDSDCLAGGGEGVSESEL
eukprot:5012991-Prymnesium_polylepis.1